VSKERRNSMSKEAGSPKSSKDGARSSKSIARQSQARGSTFGPQSNLNAEQKAVAMTLSKVNPDMKRPSKMILARLTEPARQAVEQKAAFRRAGRKLAQCNYDDPASDEPGSPKSPKSPTASKQAVSRAASKDSKVSA